MPGQPHPATPASDDLRTKALLVHERLCAAYECPIAYFHDLDPLSELVSSLLSHRTRNADSGRAFKELRRRFPTWEAVRDAPAAAVEAAVAACTWPEQKAPRVQQVLRLVGERRGGELSLDFLAGLPVPEARAWLEELPGVGPKTSAAVLAFSRLRKAALPVDSHHHRVAVRLGLIGPRVAVGPSHEILEAQLPRDWDAQKVYDNHEVMMLHGQRCCYFENPACHRCVILDLCPFGQARVGKPGTPAQAGRANTLVPSAQATGAIVVPPSERVTRIGENDTSVAPTARASRGTDSTSAAENGPAPGARDSAAPPDKMRPESAAGHEPKQHSNPLDRRR